MVSWGRCDRRGCEFIGSGGQRTIANRFNVLGTIVLMGGTVAVGALMGVFASGRAPGVVQPPEAPAVVAQSPPLAASPSATADVPTTQSPSTTATAPPDVTPSAGPSRPAATPTPPPRFTVGDPVTLRTPRHVCLQSFVTPGFASKRLVCLTDGTATVLEGGPRYIVDPINGPHWWWQLDAGGWMIENWMAPRD